MNCFDELEEGEACDYCGNPVSFRDDDWVVCPTCQAEYTNMDYSFSDAQSNCLGIQVIP